MVAVAYFGKGGASLLPLGRGSTLIVDMSRAAVGSGQTLPREILKLVNRGVNVHSVQNLHAKVFVVGNCAFIGSANVSNHSANGLIEACMETDSRTTVVSCRKFVSSLRGELITPKYAKRMQRFYKPPTFGTPTGPRTARRDLSPSHSPLWIVPLVREDWEPDEAEQEEQFMPKAQKKLRSPRRFFVEDFSWRGDGFLNRLKDGDIVVQAIDEGKNRIMVSSPARVLYIRRYKKGRSNRGIVFLESAKDVQRKNLKAVVARVGPLVKRICEANSARSLRDLPAVHALLNLWPGGGVLDGPLQ
jgi:hypothetical protein